MTDHIESKILWSTVLLSSIVLIGLAFTVRMPLSIFDAVFGVCLALFALRNLCRRPRGRKFLY